MTVLSTSSLDGNHVKNLQDDDLGIVKEIMIDASDNSIAYYILSCGGFLNMSNKLFALPAELVIFDTKRECFVLDISKEQLEHSYAFDKDNWPDFSDTIFRDSIKSYYGRRSVF